jgi:exodeoxyribonuclease V beta subunit
MTGFVDLIFRHNNRYYIIDWKTNYLGQQLKDYQFPQLKKAILNSSYLLQYVIYCVALHQHLQTTLSNYQPNLHFGGVFYFFLRGINPTIPMSGIFHDKPEADFFSQVDEMFKGVDFL